MINGDRLLLFVLLFAGCHSEPEAPRIYEAESPVNNLRGSATASACRTCSGGKNVGEIGGPGDGVLRFNGIVAGKDQDYLVTFYYSNGSTANLTGFVDHNGRSVPVIFTPSGGWLNLASVSARVHLSGGSNSLEIYNHMGHFIADIDRIVVTPAPPTALTYDFEAESPANTFQGSAKADGCGTCSGGKIVGYIGGPGKGILQFNAVEIRHAGSYQLIIHYANGSSEPLTGLLAVNGGDIVPLKFSPTGAWTTLATTTLPVRLIAGKNTLRFSTGGSYSADLDKITIQENMVAVQR